MLWLLFLERMGYAEPVYVTVGDIIDKCKIYQITLSPAEFKNTYRIFKRFSLIDYGDDITKEDGRVRLYPSLQFCMDIGELKQVMADYISDDMTGDMADNTADDMADDTAEDMPDDMAAEDMAEREEMPESGDTDE